MKVILLIWCAINKADSRMSVSELYNSLLDEIHLLLKERGFYRKGCCFYIRRDSNIGLIHFQKSKKTNKNEIVFTVNLGVCSGALLKFYEINPSNYPSLAVCHWQQRIGFLFEERDDVWWTISNGAQLAPIFDVLQKSLTQKAVPYLEQHISDESLQAAWLGGQSAGQTNVQRLMHLSVLLKAKDRNELLLRILKELEIDTRGKPTSRMADCHIKKLMQWV